MAEQLPHDVCNSPPSKVAHELLPLDLKGLQLVWQLDDIEPTLQVLHSGDVRLWTCKPICQHGLHDVSLLPLANKDIKRVSEFYYAPGKSDYLVYGKSRSLSPSAMVFRDWLLADLQAEHAHTHG